MPRKIRVLVQVVIWFLLLYNRKKSFSNEFKRGPKKTTSRTKNIPVHGIPCYCLGGRTPNITIPPIWPKQTCLNNRPSYPTKFDAGSVIPLRFPHISLAHTNCTTNIIPDPTRNVDFARFFFPRCSTMIWPIYLHSGQFWGVNVGN